MGNEKMLKIGAVGMGACYLVMIAVTAAEQGNAIFIVALLLFIAFFEVSVGPVMWVYCADMLPDKPVHQSRFRQQY